MAMFIVMSKPIASVIYGYGKMGETGVEAISMLLKFYSVGMLGLGLNEILSKAFFSLHDSKTPMKNSIISMVFNIALAFILYKLMSTNGLALAAAFGSIINAVLNWYCMAKKYPDMIKKNDIVSMIKSLISAFVMGVAVYAVYGVIGNSLTGAVENIITCAICGISGLAVYALMLALTRQEDIKNLLNRKG